MEKSCCDYNRLRVVFEIIEKLPSESILDLGCGEGYLEEAFPDKKIVGVDLSEQNLEIARKRAPRAYYFKADIRKFKTNEKFDIVTLIATLGGITANQEENLFKKVNEWLKPGGYFIIFVSRDIFPYSFLSPVKIITKGKWRYFKLEQLINKLKKNNFSIHSITFCGGLLSLLFNLIYSTVNFLLRKSFSFLGFKKIKKIPYTIFTLFESIEFTPYFPSRLARFFCLVVQKRQ